MNSLSFEELPAAVVELSQKIDLILNKVLENEAVEGDKLLTIEELRDFLPEKPAKQTIYQWASARQIPYEKYGKRLYFRRSAVSRWLENGRRK